MRLSCIFPIKDNRTPYAEPWRRLLAAMLDTCLLLLTATLVLVGVFAAGAPADPALSLLTWVSPVVAWLYVIAGWSAGATLGMRACAIRLARTDGRPGVGLRAALVRVAGFIVACLPIKGGLLPILYHPRRQGWHDRIAGTVVIKRGAAIAPEQAIPPRESAAPWPGWPAPDLRLALRGLPMALLIAALLVVACTYPVALRWRTHLAGLNGDASIFVWNHWFVAYALKNHLPLTHTDIIYYPLTMSLTFSTVDWLNGFIAALLQPRIGWVATFNVIWLGSLTLCIATSYVLVASVTRSRAAAMAVAPAYGLSPFFTMHGQGHVNLISAEFLPLVVLFAYGALATRRLGYSVAAGICLALGGLCDLQYLLFGSVVIAGLLAAYWWSAPRLDTSALRRQVAILCVIGAGVIVGMGWLLGPALLVGLHERYMDRTPSFNAMLLDWVTPRPIQTLWRGAYRPMAQGDSFLIESSVTPGFIVILLACYALRRRFSRMFPWWCVVIAGFLLASGAMLDFGAGLHPPALLTPLLGFPGNGFALPWRFDGFVHAANLLAGSDFEPLAPGDAIYMPFSWLRALLPFTHAFRTPVRIGLVVILAAQVLAGFGLRLLLDRMRAPAGRRLLATGVLAAMTVEFLPAPYPTSLPPTSPLFQRIAREPGRHPVINVPIGPLSDYPAEQAQHEQPTYAGFLSRTPRSAYREIQSNLFLQYCMLYGGSILPVKTDRGKMTPANLRASLRELTAMGSRYVIVHKRYVTQQQIREVDGLLAGQLGAKRVADDNYLVAYDVSAV